VATRGLEEFLSRSGRIALFCGCIYLSLLTHNLYSQVDLYLEDVEFLLRVALGFLGVASGMRVLVRLGSPVGSDSYDWKVLLWYWVHGLVTQILVSLLILQTFSAGSLSQIFQRALAPMGWAGAVAVVLLFEFVVSAVVVFGSAVSLGKEKSLTLYWPARVLWAHTIALTFILTVTML